jgi:hypothetical protein
MEIKILVILYRMPDVNPICGFRAKINWPNHILMIQIFGEHYLKVMNHEKNRDLVFHL